MKWKKVATTLNKFRKTKETSAKIEEEEKNCVSGGIKGASAQRKRRKPERKAGSSMGGQRFRKVLVYGVKSGLKVEAPRVKLCRGGGISGKIPRRIPKQTKLPKEDTDSIMNDKHTTQGRKQGGRQTQFAEDEREMERNATQQLPNSDPTSFEANNWPRQNWDSIGWGPFGYYNSGIPLMYWGDLPATQEEWKQKGAKHSVGCASSHNPRPDPLGALIVVANGL